MYWSISSVSRVLFEEKDEGVVLAMTAGLCSAEGEGSKRTFPVGQMSRCQEV